MSIQRSDAEPATAEPAGEPPNTNCQRCGRAVDMGTIGPKVGLCYCPSCQRYACRWCWAGASGRCPTCAAPFYLVGTGAAARGARSGASRRRSDLRVPLALVLFIVVVSSLGLLLGGGLRPGAGVAGETSQPTEVAAATPLHPGSGSPTGAPAVSASAAGSAGSIPSATGPTPATAGPPPSNRAPDGTTTPPPDATLAPTATPLRTPRPTITPTPRPTPPPTPTPAPTPECRTVPDLVGLTVSGARSAWTAAGFTGAFNPARGHDDMIVQTQSETGGACRPLATSVSVTYSKTPG